MLKKANLLDGKTTDLELPEVIFMLEKYYDPSHTLKSKLSQECFDAHIAANPMLLLANQRAAAKKEKEEQARKEAERRKSEGVEEGEQEGEAEAEKEAEAQEEEALDEEAEKERVEEEMKVLHAEWSKQVLSEHLVYIKGVEVVYFEFKELLIEIAMRLKDQLEVSASKPRSLVKKFLDDLFLKRLIPFIRFNLSKNEGKPDAKVSASTRAWPESTKDLAIKLMKEEKRKKQQEEERLKAEEAAKLAEQNAIAETEAAQEVNQPTEEELAKAAAEEEAAKKAQEVAEGSGEDDPDEDEEDIDEGEDDISDY